MNQSLVSKEIVVLRRWESETLKFGIIYLIGQLHYLYIVQIWPLLDINFSYCY